MFYRHGSLFMLILAAVSLGVASPTRKLASSSSSLRSVKKAFHDAGLPESLSIEFNPKYTLSVSFPQTEGCTVDVQVGDHVEQNATASMPTFTLSDPKSRDHVGLGPFVIATVDPDAPTPQNASVAQVRHFLGGSFASPSCDCHARSDVGLLTNSTPAISYWYPPSPPAGSDPHRYTFLVFEQPDGFDADAVPFVNASSSILGFNVSLFAEEVGLGSPVAGSYMLVAASS